MVLVVVRVKRVAAQEVVLLQLASDEYNQKITCSNVVSPLFLRNLCFSCTASSYNMHE